MSRSWTREIVISRARCLLIWDAVGYRPKLGSYGFHTEDEAQYVDRVIRHLARDAYLLAKQTGRPFVEADVYELALDEYFHKKDGVIAQITRARVRLTRLAHSMSDDGWKRPTEAEFQETIRVLLAERREKRENGRERVDELNA